MEGKIQQHKEKRIRIKKHKTAVIFKTKHFDNIKSFSVLFSVAYTGNTADDPSGINAVETSNFKVTDEAYFSTLSYFFPIDSAFLQDFYRYSMNLMA